MSELRFITRQLLLCATLLFGVRAEAQAQTPTTESQIKAMFVYNFLKFVEWPPDATLGPTDPFVILIIGDGATADATANFLASKSIGERPLLVLRNRSDQSLVGARAAFVVERDAKKLHRVLDAAAAASVLTIGEGDSFTTQGGVIGLIVQDRKVRFDVDTSAAQNAGLRISSKLLTLTRAIRSSTDRAGDRE